MFPLMSFDQVLCHREGDRRRAGANFASFSPLFEAKISPAMAPRWSSEGRRPLGDLGLWSSPERLFLRTALFLRFLVIAGGRNFVFLLDR